MGHGHGSSGEDDMIREAFENARATVDLLVEVFDPRPAWAAARRYIEDRKRWRLAARPCLVPGGCRDGGIYCRTCWARYSIMDEHVRRQAR